MCFSIEFYVGLIKPRLIMKSGLNLNYHENNSRIFKTVMGRQLQRDRRKFTRGNLLGATSNICQSQDEFSRGRREEIKFHYIR